MFFSLSLSGLQSALLQEEPRENRLEKQEWYFLLIFDADRLCFISVVVAGFLPETPVPT